MVEPIMYFGIGFLVASLLGLVLPTAFGATVRAADHAADEAAIRKSGDEFVAAWNKNDERVV